MSRRSALGASCLALLLAACSGGERTLWLSYPPAGTATRSMLLAVQLEGSLRVFAYALDPAPARIDPPIVFPDDGSATLVALLYDAPLSEMSIAPGEVAPASGADTRALPDTPRMFGASLSDTTWRALAMPPPGVMSFRTAKAPPPADPCAVFTYETLGIQSPGDVHYLVPLAPDLVLVGVDQGTAYAAGADKRLTRLATPPGAPGYYPAAGGVRTSDGFVWLGGRDGELYRARPNPDGTIPSVELVATSSTGEPLRWLAGGPLPNGDTEVFALGKKGSVERWDGHTLTQLYQLENNEMGLGKGGVAWLGPNRAIVVSGAIAAAIRYEGGRVVREEVASGGEAFTAVTPLPDGTLVIGSDHGRLYEQAPGGGSWRPLEPSMLSLHLNMVAPFERGFVYGGVAGFFNQWLPERGFCTIRQLGAQTLRFIVPLGEGFLVAGDHGPSSDLPLVLLTRVR